MVPVMHRLEPLLIDVRINLGRRNIRMPQQLLDDAQVRPIPQQVRREGMPQQMRIHIHVNPRVPRDPLYDLPDPHRRQFRPADG